MTTKMHEFMHNDEKIVKVGEPIFFKNKTEWIPSRGEEKATSRCIDVDETLKAMDTWDKFGVLPNGTVIPFRNCENADDYVPYVKYEDMVNCVKNMPTADVVEVVRCKDCRWGKKVSGNVECWADINVPPEYHGYEWFCPNGERREDGMVH